MVARVLESETKLSILIDESTTISKKSVLIIYSRASLDGNEEPLNVFLDLVELAATKAEDIYRALIENLTHDGFIEKNKAGVAAKIVQMFPNVLIWHCMNHRRWRCCRRDCWAEPVPVIF